MSKGKTPTHDIERTFSGAPWEPKVGYCRAIRMENTIAITGTISPEHRLLLESFVEATGGREIDQTKLNFKLVQGPFLQDHRSSRTEPQSRRPYCTLRS